MNRKQAKKLTEPFMVAAIEFNPEMFELERNIERACEAIREAAQNGARLIVLPEAAVSGYIYKDLEQFLPYMDSVPGMTTNAIAELTSEFGCYVAIGIAEQDPATSLTYNTGALVGPDGYVGKYRKVGLNPSDINWFVPGNTGYPVFETELGNIAMVICYDDTYWEPARLPAIKGADIIAYICSSDRVLVELETEAKGNHSTIAAVQQLSTWNGLAMVAADRNNAETNPTTGVTVTYGGCASIWQADGERIAHSPATTANTTITNPGSILYGDLDPKRFDNDQRSTLQRRRPEMYGDLAFYRAPVDGLATTSSSCVAAVALQYRVVPNDFDGNVSRAESFIEQVQSADCAPGVLVLPAFSFWGQPETQNDAHAGAESTIGRSVQVFSDFAVRTRKHVVGTFIERDGAALFHTVALVSPDGTVVGRYRQTHLDPVMAEWASAGDDLAVFDTEIGRIGLLTCEDVRFPEASGVLAVRRADIIAIPTHWSGTYGGALQDAGGLFQEEYPANTMCNWYAIAKLAQAYTIVANPIDDGCQGSSGIFSINPVDSDQVPVVASTDAPEIVRSTFNTLGAATWWMNQQRLIAGRRADLVVPAVLSTDSDAFAQWKNSAGYDITAWTAYFN